MRGLLKNPITVWLRWLLVKLYLEWKYSRKHLKLGYLAYVANCEFGNYNTLYDHAILTNVALGDFSYVGDSTKLANVRIGKFSCIGPEVIAGLGAHPTRDFVSSHPIFYSPRCQAQITFSDHSLFEEFAQINIGNDVWIGARAIVLDGITIGDGAIVGAGAVVTKNIPAYAVVGGVPAKVIRYRFESDEIDFLKQLRWWDKDIKWLRDNSQFMRDISKIKHLI